LVDSPNTIPTTKQKAEESRLLAIDFLRGFAALAVVFHHAFAWRPHPQGYLWLDATYAVASRGHLGVPLFFVISGFCIHLRLAKRSTKEQQPRIDFVDFWKRRLRRLYPPYFVVLCLSMTLLVIAFVFGRHVPLLDAYPNPKPKWMIADFVAHTFMLHGFYPLFDKGGGNPVFWTLAREEYFYLMYIGLVWWRWKYGLINSLVGVFVVGVTFSIVADVLLPVGSPWLSLAHSSALVLWIQWFLGMAAVEAYLGLWRLPVWCSLFWLVPVWGILAELSSTYVPLLEPTFWGMAFFTLTNYCVALEQRGGWPSSRVFTWFEKVGVFSYSLYLVHNPVRAVLKQLIDRVSLENSQLAFFLGVLALSVTAYIAGKIFFFLVERRFLPTKS
jgi:peptidoglycan/LPS O-acetylase OafA/YrhL